MKNKKLFLIIGRRWFQKLYGNTYHTVKVINIKTGEFICTDDYHYGYGDHYIVTAFKFLAKNIDFLKNSGIKKSVIEQIKKDKYSGYKLRDYFISEHVDVDRQRDLFF